jgi:hypothetical protein
MTLRSCGVPMEVGCIHTIHPGSQKPSWIDSYDPRITANIRIWDGFERRPKIHQACSKCRPFLEGDTYRELYTIQGPKINTEAGPSVGLRDQQDSWRSGTVGLLCHVFFSIFSTSSLILSLSTEQHETAENELFRLPPCWYDVPIGFWISGGRSHRHKTDTGNRRSTLLIGFFRSLGILSKSPKQ